MLAVEFGVGGAVAPARSADCAQSVFDRGHGGAGMSDGRRHEFELVLRPRAAISLADFADVWRYRDLLLALAVRDVSVRYKQAALGIAWALLQPLSQMLIFTLLFNRMAGIRADIDAPYPLFVLSGLVAWMVFANGLGHASDSLVANANMISKVYFPRVVVPLAALGPALVDFAISLPLLLLMTLAFGQPLHATMVLCLPIGLLAALCAFAMGLWTSAINIQFRDVRYALPFVLQLLIFLTPVFYVAPPRFRPFFNLNPMAAVVEAFRAAALGSPLPWWRLALSTAVTLVFGLLGFIYFRKMEQTFADRV
jgi:lipopolysaccharide transport system permease protein